ncbi:hypothetical protein C5P26_24425 [Escherichia coli]|nr:hypothetical protein C7235_04715 [Escherichia coli]PPZ39495.1 hypothetical protein C5P26_24425 [Escherichia coli]RLL76209.1 hypothetical protein D8711_23755 [Escherichia coli]RLX73888.1 hypothetical protein EAI47_22755 [Escherichia coli]HAG9054774.1 hypothetical protein [Escherichia coli]
MLPSETMIWQPEFTDKTLSRKPGAVQSAFMRGISSPMRVTQEGPDGLSRYCPVRVICLEIQLCFLTGAPSWLIKLPKLPLWVAWIHIKICTLPLS